MPDCLSIQKAINEKEHNPTNSHEKKSTTKSLLNTKTEKAKAKIETEALNRM